MHLPAPVNSARAAGSAPCLVVLDLDGTLVRLAVDWADVRGRLLDLAHDHGLEVDHAGVMGLLAAARRTGGKECAAAMENVVREAEIRGAEEGPANVALREWVDDLPLDTALAVLSLNSRPAVERAVRRAGLWERVEAIVAREDVVRHKPHPEGLVRIMKHCSADARGTLMVGDSPGDHGCARAAGAASLDITDIGVHWEPVA